MKREKKRRSRGNVPALLLSFGIAFMCAAVYLLTDARSYLAAAAIMLLCGIPLCVSLFGAQKRRQQNTGIVCTMVGMLAVTVYLLAVPPHIRSEDLRQYPYQKRLAKLYQNRAVTVPNWFLEFQDDVTGDYRMEYDPGGLRAEGLFSVRFRTEPERAASYAAVFEAESCSCFPLRDYWDGMHMSLPDADAEAGTAEGLLTLKPAQSFWADNLMQEPTAVVYIMNANLKKDTPVTGAAIIDTENGRVQFLQIGRTA